MPFKSEYDLPVIRCNQAAVVVLAFAVIASLGAQSQAQTVHGTPPSVTSLGFGGTGNAPHGLPPSVTSLGFGRINGVSPGQFHHHHNFGNSRRGVFYFPYAYPYVVDGPPSNAYDDDQYNDEYNGGPTVFDRRGPGTPAPAPDSSRDIVASADATPASSPAPQAEAIPQPPTVLVFKDGHEVEIANYAIVGTTLYDLSEERRWKIALSELDLPATVKQNDDRGLDFQIPASAQANSSKFKKRFLRIRTTAGLIPSCAY